MGKFVKEEAMVKEYAVIITEDIMSANNKTEDMLPDVIQRLGHYGKVIPLSDYTKAKSDEYQATIDALTSQLDRIVDQDLSVDEMKIVKTYRENKTEVVAEYLAEVEKYKSELEGIRREFELKTAKLKAILGE